MSDRLVDNFDYSSIGHDIIGAAFDVRKNVGRGLREAYYEAALQFELEKRGRKAQRQVIIPALYCGKPIDNAYHADIIVDDRVIIEVKALANMGEAECRQLYTYLRLSDFKLGYLINFGARDFRIGKTDEPMPFEHGIYRYVNNLYKIVSPAHLSYLPRVNPAHV